jgi:anti-sigma28 factor (negative regulator of flagellin synthesis)
MKIDNTNVHGASPDRVEQNREAAVVRAGFDRNNRAGSQSGNGDDQIDLSGLSQALSAASSDSPEQLAKVEKLAELYASGRYAVDSKEVSRRVVEDALRP